MKILFCGDVVGQTGRKVVVENIPSLRKRWGLDWVVVNGENSAHGFGITPKICEEFYDAGVDIITTGNHAWGQKSIIPYILKDPMLLRPMNFPQGTPGSGVCVAEHPGGGKKFVVLHVLTRLFMEPVDDPFVAIEEALREYSLRDPEIGGIMIDIHGEASSEKMAIGQMVDGRVSLVVGTHTHIPTGDAQILPQGTAYQTDAGMCGDYDSVIGMEKMNAIARFKNRVLAERLTPAEGKATLCGVYAELDSQTGLATKVTPVRVGGRLKPAFPGD